MTYLSSYLLHRANAKANENANVKINGQHSTLSRLVALLLLLFVGLPAQAIDYTFSTTSTTLPVGCFYVSGGSYTCPVLTLAAGDTIAVDPNTSATINVVGTFTVIDASVNAGGLASNLNIVVVGTVAVSNALVNANVESVAAVNINTGGEIRGNLSASTPTGVITLGTNATVSGYISTDDGAVTVGIGSKVGGALTTVAGVVTLGANVNVGGNVSTEAGAITMGNESTVGGSVGSTGAGVVTLGAKVTVVRGVNTEAGAITLGNESNVGGNVASTGAGVITLGSLVVVGGEVLTAAGAINIGDGSTVCGNVGTTGAGVVTLTTNVSVGGSVNTISGAVTIGAGSTVQGSIIITGAGVLTLTSVNVGGDLYTFTGVITATTSLVRGTVTQGNVEIFPTWADQTDLALPPATACSVTLSFDHFQIEHDGEGSTCAMENVKVKACADVMCNTLVDSGDITATILPFGSTISIGINGWVTLSVTPSTAGTNILSAILLSPMPTTDSTVCLNTTTNDANCSLLVSACASGGFECLETGTHDAWNASARKALYTKLAGSPFVFDVVALNADGMVETHYVSNGGTAKTVTVELVDGANNSNSDNACIDRTAISPAVSQTLSFTKGDAGRKTSAPMTVNKVYNNLRCRVTDTNESPSVVACSSDNFSVRPSATTLLTSASAAAPLATATPVIKAGENFTFSATTQDNSNNYTGTLELDGSKLTAQTPSQVDTQQSGGAVGTLSPSSLVANAAAVSATYSEVGYLYLAAGAYRDDLFTKVDKGNGDCITDTSNDNNLTDTLVDGKYGCSIGNKAAVSLGRFIPDHFETTLTKGCATFTYSGQPLTTFKVSAYGVGGTSDTGRTQNYAGAFSKAISLTDANDVTGDNGSLSFTNIAQGAFTDGFYSDSSLSYAFDPITQAPATIQLRAAETTDGDGVTSLDPMEGTTQIRSGRVRILNAFGSELLDLPMTMRAEYWQSNAKGWQTNTADSCTTATLSFADVANPDFKGNTCVLDTGTAPGNSGEGCGGDAPPTDKQYKDGNFADFAGNFNLILRAPGDGNEGSIDIKATVPVWLQYNWTGTVGNPQGRATFGVYKSKSDKIIQRRELY